MKVSMQNSRSATAANEIVRHVEAFKSGETKERFITYQDLSNSIGGVPLGMGHVLSDVLADLKSNDLPRGLTLFVTTADGKIKYDKSDEWEHYDIGPHNSLKLRKEVMAFDWSKVDFCS